MGREAAGTIATFVSMLEPSLVGNARLRRRLAEEMRGHLEDAAESYSARGMSWSEAEYRAIEDFGPPEVVVGDWAESKGVGVPTTFTKYAGLAGIIGALGLGASLIYQQMSESYSRGMFAEVSLSFVALFAISLVAVYMRVRGKLVPYGRLGPRVAIFGFLTIVISLRFWFAPGALIGMIAILVGLGTFFVGTIRTGVIPKGPVSIWLAGIAATVVIALVGPFLDLDAGMPAAMVGIGALAIGWAWLGMHLWSEDPQFEHDHELVAG